MTYSERSVVGYRTKVQRTYKPDVPGFHGQRNIVKPISSPKEGKGSRTVKPFHTRPCLPMRMCKWNKFRGNNSTTISLQSADIGARKDSSTGRAAAGSMGPKRRSPCFIGDLSWSDGFRPPFCRRQRELCPKSIPFYCPSDT